MLYIAYALQFLTQELSTFYILNGYVMIQLRTTEWANKKDLFAR